MSTDVVWNDDASPDAIEVDDDGTGLEVTILEPLEPRRQPSAALLKRKLDSPSTVTSGGAKKPAIPPSTLMFRYGVSTLKELLLH